MAVAGLPDLDPDVAAAVGDIAGRVFAGSGPFVGADIVAFGGAVPASSSLAGAPAVDGGVSATVAR
jgi:hypothetical protein